MAEYITLDDQADPRARDYVGLRDSSLRNSLEAERGLFVAEGEKVIRRAIAAGYRPRSFLLAERWLPALSRELAGFDGPVYLVSEELAEQITGFHVHRGALAALHRELRHSVAQVLGGQRIVVAEDIVDHANVGAIIRNAAGLGWDGLLISPRCADPLYRRAVKVSMGAVFRLPWARLDDWATTVPMLRQAGFLVAALALREDATALEPFAARMRAKPGKLAILLGTEGAGLSQRWIEQADLCVRIPMRAGIDSLNVAAASAIACYALGPVPG
ncbi:MAG: RNA methyltransferase [Propionibacteriaceae bacterium]|jgi:tRNA G18 (ribose-2'-O)-methylase SpoU|nr:RNA methyltransferase [Propionibacteriaceae bacterium]